MNPTIKGVLYSRYSPRPIDTKSTQHQASDLIVWCENNGVTPFVFCWDPEVSGTVSLWERPGLAKAIACLRPGSLLVVRNLNRIARDALVALVIEKEVRQHKSSLASIEDGGVLDDDPQSRFMRLMKYGFAELQRHEINARTSRRFKHAIHTEHRKMCSQAPYGYRFNAEDKIVGDAMEQEVIHRVRSLKIAGFGYRKTAVMLNDEGFRMRSGGPWTPSGVGRIVRKCLPNNKGT